MKSPSLKNKLKKNQVTIGSWITVGNESIAEIMARQKFDWLVVDMEHSAIDFPQAQNLVRVISLCGVPPLVRVGENSANLIKRSMDTGAHGVIVPMVNSKKEAQMAVEAVKYPPLGKRGVGLSRAQDYGSGFKEYKDWLARESVVIVQVEHIDAVRNLEGILSVEGVDGFLVGPYDLSGSLGRPGDFAHPEVKKALAEVMRVAIKFNANPGIHVIAPDAKELSFRIKQGYKFISFSLDTLFLSVACKNLLNQVLSKEA